MAKAGLEKLQSVEIHCIDLAWYYYYFSTCMSWYLHAGTCADRTWFIMVLQPRLSKVPSYRIIEVYNKFSQVDLVLGI